MMTFLRVHIAFTATMFAAAMMLVPASAQAACNGGACSITGGSLRTTVGAGFIIPHLSPLASQSGPTGAPLTFANTANGFILPVPGAQVTAETGVHTPNNPLSLMMQIGQLTYGSAATPGLSGTPYNPGRFTTPKLVQVPLFPAPSHALFGVSTNIGQSFPGDVRTYMNGTLPSTSFMTTIGGPAVFKAGGRPGAAVLNHCAGAIVPNPITPLWGGGCAASTPLTINGTNLGPKVTNVIVTYTATSNQFGGRASQRQVKRTSQAGVPPVANNWLGRIRFNRFFPAPYTTVQMLNTTIPKTYPTLEQGLVEPVVWGASFGQIVQRIGALVPPGDLVSGRVTPAGGPVNIATQIVTPLGTGMGAGAQTSTSWGGPLTTGRVMVNANNTGISSTMWTNTGADQRTSMGEGQVSMVSGGISLRISPPPVPPQGGTERTMLTLKLPEPSMALGLIAGVTVLAGVSRRRRS